MASTAGLPAVATTTATIITLLGSQAPNQRPRLWPKPVQHDPARLRGLLPYIRSTPAPATIGHRDCCPPLGRLTVLPLLLQGLAVLYLSSQLQASSASCRAYVPSPSSPC
ncbi:hypothetical protein HPP92_009731 [Vanilla planifolia]|uniref:Uncharacterized protein n=1 Tax=Vanilla planifolia TaxID=51239 RepID=A0A835REG6_VANPL|nr:hypothetical protein HPP92_009966 [Vanilla planifolia]KAG0487636.1 hypothetical protein HPP92_009731 [Vanilla planifolia]